jgi:hypothetical protein
MLVGAKISAVLRRALRPWAPLLNDGLRRTAELWAQVYPAPTQDERPRADARLDELMRLYASLGEAERRSFLLVLRATATAMASEAADSRGRGA